jgi:transcriptional regulator with XRE-family HTH domain
MPRKDNRVVLTYIAAHVRRMREAQGFTQEALAERAGLELRYVQKIERGAVNLGVTVLAALAQALQVPPGDLFERTRALPAPKRGRPVGTGVAKRRRPPERAR